LHSETIKNVTIIYDVDLGPIVNIVESVHTLA